MIVEIANSKLFVGITMLIMNYGSRYVVSDITKYHEHILNSPLGKKIVLFCMAFVATRDLLVAFILTFALTIILDVLMNEKSRFSVLPYSVKKHFLKNN